MKKILIAGYEKDCVNYINALKNLGTDPVASPDTDKIKAYDGLLLPGGGDIHPSFFRQENKGSQSIDRELDKKQFRLLKQFTEAQKPVLGICKGMQVINVFFGGDIVQDLPNADSHKSKDGFLIHMTKALPEFFLYKLYGKEFMTNSSHHQGCGSLGKNLTAVSYSFDGVMEGLCHNILPVIGVQWHPERMCFDKKTENTVDGSYVLQYFLDMC